MASDTGGPRTLIVKGLGPKVTEESFETFFSDQGPVSRSFLVRQGKGGPHKGYGFVQFALASDAKQAAAILDGKRLEGHRIKVQTTYYLVVAAGKKFEGVIYILLLFMLPSVGRACQQESLSR